jgi:hypothetical protein
MWSKDRFSMTKTTMVLMGCWGGGIAETTWVGGETCERVRKSKKTEANEGTGPGGLALEPPILAF